MQLLAIETNNNKAITFTTVCFIPVKDNKTIYFSHRAFEAYLFDFSAHVTAFKPQLLTYYVTTAFANICLKAYVCTL